VKIWGVSRRERDLVIPGREEKEKSPILSKGKNYMGQWFNGSSFFGGF